AVVRQRPPRRRRAGAVRLAAERPGTALGSRHLGERGEGGRLLPYRREVTARRRPAAILARRQGPPRRQPLLRGRRLRRPPAEGTDGRSGRAVVAGEGDHGAAPPTPDGSADPERRMAVRAIGDADELPQRTRFGDRLLRLPWRQGPGQLLPAD